MKTTLKITQIKNSLAKGTWSGDPMIARALIDSLPIDNNALKETSTALYYGPISLNDTTHANWTKSTNLEDMNGAKATQKIAELGAITTLYIGEESAPLFRQFPGQYSPQDAYLEISADGSVIASYNDEVGNQVPVSVYHRIDHRLTIPNTLTARGVLQVIEEHANQLNTIIAGMGERWDGSNTVGTLTPDATHALESLEQNLRELQYDDFDYVAIEDVRNVDTASVLGDEKIHAHTTDEELTAMAERIRSDWRNNIEEADLIVLGLHDLLEEIREELRED